MAVFALGGSQEDRIGRADRSGNRPHAGNSKTRAQMRVRTARQIAASFAVLLLIMCGGLAFRALIALPLGFSH